MATKKKTTEPQPKLSLMKAALAVLTETEEAMNTKSIVDAAKEKGIWSPGAGKTPEQTLYSTFARDIKAHGAAAKVVSVGRGLFKLNQHS